MKLWLKIIIGLTLGVITGLVLKEKAIYLKPLGDIFLSLIRMIIIPLLLSSTAVGVASIQDPQKLGRLGAKTIGFYLFTTLCAIGIGLLFANTFEIGKSLHLKPSQEISTTLPSIQNLFSSILPSNLFTALVQENILQIIIFACFLGVAMHQAKELSAPLLHLLRSIADVMFCLTSMIMQFAPIAVFGMMAWAVGTFGTALLIPLCKFLFLYYLACTLHFCFIYGTLLQQIAKLSPLTFLKGMRETAMVAFSTGSSAAALPIAMENAYQKLGVSKNICSFVLPLGLTLNMNGTAIYQAMSALFIAQGYGISLTFTHYFMIIFVTILSAIGTAGVPGGGFMMLSMVLTAIGLPLESLAILASIDRLREMVAALLNILGDAAIAVIIAKQEQE